MDRRQLMYGMAAVGLAGRLNLSDLLAAQTAELQTADLKTSRARQIYPPDRELDEPRGGVKMCVEETRSSRGDGSVTTRIKEYDPDGNLIAFRNERDGRVVFSTADPGYTEVRDDQDHVVKMICAPEKGQPSRESYYTYDSAGRILTTTQNLNSDRIEYRYGPDGAMVSIHTFDPKTIEGTKKTAFAGSQWSAARFGAGVPTGGMVIISYDNNCNEIDLRVLSSDGQVVTQIVRKYDLDGRLLEEKPLQQNIALLMLDRMTPEQKAQVTPAHIEAISKAVAGKMAGKKPSITTYSYDAQGRLIQKRERNPMFEQTKTIRYNDYGDRIEVSTTFTDNSVTKRDLPVRATNERYSYQYDSHGNWTEKVKTVDDRFSVTERRTLTYY
jgi:hypothetical protein